MVRERGRERERKRERMKNKYAVSTGLSVVIFVKCALSSSLKNTLYKSTFYNDVNELLAASEK